MNKIVEQDKSQKMMKKAYPSEKKHPLKHNTTFKVVMFFEIFKSSHSISRCNSSILLLNAIIILIRQNLNKADDNVLSCHRQMANENE